MSKTFCCSSRTVMKALPSPTPLAQDHGVGVFTWVNVHQEETVEYVPVLPYGIPLKNHQMVQCQFKWGDGFCIPSGFLPYYRHSYIPNVKICRNMRNNSMSVKAICPMEKGTELFFNHDEEKAIKDYYYPVA
jgi:hypothetical protein